MPGSEPYVAFISRMLRRPLLPRVSSAISLPGDPVTMPIRECGHFSHQRSIVLGSVVATATPPLTRGWRPGAVQSGLPQVQRLRLDRNHDAACLSIALGKVKARGVEGCLRHCQALPSRFSAKLFH